MRAGCRWTEPCASSSWCPTASSRQRPHAEPFPNASPHEDAAFNLSRMGLLVAGLADHRLLLAEAGDDRLHQPARSALFPEATRLLGCLRDAGALTSCWSGAGPCLLGICTHDTERAVLAKAREAMQQLQVQGRALVLEADLSGTEVRELH